MVDYNEAVHQSRHISSTIFLAKFFTILSLNLARKARWPDSSAGLELQALAWQCCECSSLLLRHSMPLQATADLHAQYLGAACEPCCCTTCKKLSQTHQPTNMQSLTSHGHCSDSMHRDISLEHTEHLRVCGRCVPSPLARTVLLHPPPLPS